MPLSGRTLRPANNAFTPKSISGLSLWLDGADASTTYTTDAGPVVAVTDPRDITGCVGWWDSSDLSVMRQNSDGTGVVAAGDPVGYWADKSSTGAHVTGSGSARPTLSATGFNSKQALVFNGSSTNLSNASYTATNNLSGMTRIAVCAHTTNTVAMLSRVNGGGSDSFMQMNGGVRAYVTSGAANFLNVPLGTGNNIVPAGLYGEVFSNSAISFYSSGAGLAGTVNGTIPATTGGGSPVLHIGSNVGVNFFWNGPIAEHIIFNRALTRAELASVESYLAAKWGITGVHRSASQEIAAVSSPTELAGCAGWWDCSRTDKMFNATTGGSLVANGGAVLRLEDLSGNGKHLIQATSGSAPSRQDGAKNGLPALNFAGTKFAAAGSIGDWNFLHNTQGGTVIAVIKPFDTADPQTFAYGVATNVGGGSNGIGWSLFFDDRVSGYSRNNYVHHSVSGGVSGQSVVFQEQNNALPSANDFSLLSFTPFAGSSTTAGRGGMYVSGTATATANAATLAPSAANSANTLTVGNPSNSLAGLAELIVYNTVLSAVDRARVEKYLQQKWATPTVPDPTPPVGYWADKSGNARHATQSTAGSRPLVGTQNSRKALTFDGTDDFLSADIATSSLCSTAGGVAFYVAVPNNDSTWVAFSNSGVVGGIDRFADNASYHGNFRATRFNSITSGAYSTTGAQLIVSRANASTGLQTIRKDGATIYSAAENIAGYRGLLATSSVNVGCTVTSLGQPVARAHFLAGSIPEVVCYSSPLTDVQVRRVEAYLAARWGIALAPQVSNADAQDWINRVYAAGSVVSATQAEAVNTFCEAIESSGIREKFYRLNLHTGGTTGSAAGLAASLVPLYRGPSLTGTQYGNAIDAQSPTPFTAADYSTTDGLFAGLNSGKYLDTGLASNAMPQSVYQALHLSAWHGNVAYAGTDPCLIGAFNLTTDRNEIHISLRATPASDDARLGQTAQVISVTQLSGARYPASYIASRTSPTSLRLYRNGVFESETTTSTTSPGNSYPLYVHRRNGTGTPSGEQTGMSIWAYSIGAGMTPQQVTDYYNAMTAFNTAMGRLFFAIPQVSNADAQSWITRVYNNGGTVSATTATAVNDFCNAIDAAGIRSRFYRLNLFCGGTSGSAAGLAACLVPLYRGPSVGGTQYGGYIDTNNGPFTTSDYTATGAGGGLLGNGTSKYLNTGLTVSNIGTASEGHMSVYHGQSSGVDVNRYYMGANDASTANRFYFGTDSFSTANVFGSYGATQNASQPLAANGHGAAGHRIISRDDGVLTHYYNGSEVATNETSITPAVSTAAFAVFAANRNNTVDRWHNSWMSAYSIGLGLDPSQASTYTSILQTFQTALGRNV